MLGPVFQQGSPSLNELLSKWAGGIERSSLIDGDQKGEAKAMMTAARRRDRRGEDESRLGGAREGARA